ncbi:MAG: DoxX family protein [Verrucomicrobiota bacterium]
MGTVSTILQLVIPLGILNVWLLRSKRATAYRGGDAKDLKGEFMAYGLPEAFFYIIGTLKLSAAALLLLGFVWPALVLPGAALMATLMLGAVLMHAKVKDPLIRYLPASLMLAMSLIILF